MGGALMSGWISSGLVKPAELLIIDPKPGAQAQSVIEQGAVQGQLSDKAAKNRYSHIEMVLLSIKPQLFGTLGADIKAVIPDKALIISIMAGTSLASLQDIFASNPLIRAMPNTPAAIGAGITAFTGKVSDAHKSQAQTLLLAGGAVHEVENETLIDVVTAVSGSGPAYVFHMVEALESAAIRIGMPPELAPDFARQTIIGAGALLAASSDSAGDLRAAVTSPNGTTQAALDILMRDNGLIALMRETVKAALDQAKALAKA